MVESNICLEGIAHDQTLDLSVADWQRLLDLGRWHGWRLPNEMLWCHFYTPIRDPEPLPAPEARHLADALEGALVSQCTHHQYSRDPGVPAALVDWCTTPAGKQALTTVITLLRQGGVFVSLATVW